MNKRQKDRFEKEAEKFLGFDANKRATKPLNELRKQTAKKVKPKPPKP